MHHLSDEEFQAAKEDILSGLAGYYQNYFAYARVCRGMRKLEISPEELPDQWRPFLDFFSQPSRTREALEAILSIEGLLEQAKDDPDPPALVANLQSMGEVLERVSEFLEDGGLPPRPEPHTHYCPICEAIFPCLNGLETCDQLPELWCDSCKVKKDAGPS